MKTRFTDKVVIITGAAQGIGRGVALQVAKEGAKVLLVDRSPFVHQVKKEILQKSRIADYFIADLETFKGAELMVKKALETYGKIDVLINNVGGAIWMKPFETFSSEEIMNEINRSLLPTLWGCRAVIPFMVEQNQGVIVNVSSIATRGVYRIPYSAAKGGVNAITQSLAFEFSKKGIRINAVATGGTVAPERLVPRNELPLTEDEKKWAQDVVDQTISSTHFKRYGTIEEQVNAILFLASDESSYMTGSIIPVGGGDQG